MKKFIMILMLALSFISIPMISRPAHAFSCPLSSANNKIDGCVVNGDTGNPVSGLYVYIIDCGGFQLTDYSITDSNGHFSFQTTLANGSPCINPNQAYVVSVNGVTSVTWVDGCYVPNCNVLGLAADIPTWSQWAGDVSTNSNGYGSIVIQDSPARTVNVLASSLFSNTQLASMGFSTTQGQTVSQTVGIQVSIGGASNIQAGYQHNPSYTFSSVNAFTVNPNVQAWYGIPSYVIGYYCAGSTSEQLYGWTCSQGLVNAGVTEATGAAYHITPTIENLNPTSAQVLGSSITCPISVPAGTTQSIGYTGAASTSSTFSISSTLSLFGIGVTLSYSSSTSWQTEDATTVTISPTNGYLNFRFYPASGQCNNPVFGPELHVWDMNADFSLSANPSSLSIFQGKTAASTINLTPINEFPGTATLSSSGAPSGVTVSFSPSTVSSSTPSSTMTVAVGSTVPTGTYTIAVTGTGPYQSHTVNVPLTVNPPPDFSISSDPSSLSITLGSEVHDTIYVTSINGFSGNVTLTQSPSSGAVGCWFTGGASSITLSVPSNGQVSTLPACAGWGPAGSYSVTFTATNGSLTHSVTVPIQVMDFSISGPAVTSTASSSTSATITLSSLNGFAGTVNLSATSSPSGLTVSCPPSATVSSGGSVSASCSFSSSTGGTYVATITGSYAPTNEYYNAPISHSAGLTINILGGFTMSLNPTELLKYCQPYGCPYALQNTSNLTITSIGSFSGTVTLSYIAPNPSGGTTVSGPSSVYVPAGGSATVTVSGTFSNTKNTAFFWTIAGQSGRYSANATLDVYYWVCSRNCPNTKISSTSATSAPASPALASSSITSQSAMSSATATIVNSLTGDSTGLQIVRRPAPTVGVSLSTTSRAS